MDGTPFKLQFDHFFAGYKRRRRTVPQAWLDRVKIVVERSHGWGHSSSGGYTTSKPGSSNPGGYYYQPETKPRWRE